VKHWLVLPAIEWHETATDAAKAVTQPWAFAIVRPLVEALKPGQKLEVDLHTIIAVEIPDDNSDA
jgi:hypothetical protein